MKEAMRNKDRKTAMLMRMIKAKVTEYTTSKGYQGESGDSLWLPIIESYVKASKKILADYTALGDEGAAHAEEISWEISSLEIYLPQKADEDTTRTWVMEAINALGGAEHAKVGMVMGSVMKAHKADVDPQLVRKLVSEFLA